ncbi:50S ribosomal protein L13, partial [Staphylococcus pseudintermedius]
MTKTAKVNDIVRDWVVLDAKDKVFGRLITEIAV